MDNTFSLLYVFLIVAVSAVFYRHDKAEYSGSKSKKIKSPQHFEGIYRYLQISTLGFYAWAVFEWPTTYGILFSSVATTYAGLILSTVGLLIFISAKLDLGSHYSPCFDSYVPEDIVQTGVYKFIRHPIYTANIFILGGLFVASGHVGIAFNVTLLVVYYVWSAQAEEKALSTEFASYRTYKARTGMFVPRLRRPNVAASTLRPAEEIRRRAHG